MPRRYRQFTLAQLTRWVFFAAALCMVLRHMEGVLTDGPAAFAMLLLWLLLAGLASAGAVWGQFWDTIVGRYLLTAMLLVVAIAFSPLILFCFDWDGLRRRWQNWWRSDCQTLDRADAS